MTPCTCHPGNVCASAASCAAARRVEFGANMTTTQADALPEFVTAIDYADNTNDTTTNMIDVRVPIGARLALQSQPEAKCDGNHGGPRCADPECWNDSPAQPAAAGVSDAEIDRTAQIIASDQGCGWPHIPESWKEGFRETASAILALRPQSESEPFGYFRSHLWGWTDCGPDDEGAMALYERPQAVPMTGKKARLLSREELAGCCGGCASNSAIETWMRRAIEKFCEVNGITAPAGGEKQA